MLNKKDTGLIGEEYAAELLTKSGYKIIKKNYRTRFAEIDIIAIKDNTLVFIEVKTRHNLKYGKPEEAVSTSKIDKIIKAGLIFSKNNNFMPLKMRIDVVSLEVRDNKVVSEKIIPIY